MTDQPKPDPQDGWQLVPVECTPDMVRAAPWVSNVRYGWKLMLAAAPASPKPTSDVAKGEEQSRDDVRNDPAISRTVKDAMEHYWKLADQYDKAAPPKPAPDAIDLGPHNTAFHAALRKYPDSFEALHYFWNEAFAPASRQPLHSSSDGERR